jgi:hypothetical protein
MSAYVEFLTENDGKVIIETTSSSSTVDFGDPKLAKVAGIGDVLRRVSTGAEDVFEKAVSVVTSTHARAFYDALQSVASPPNEATLEFGLKVSADLGSIVVSKIAAESNYTVKLTWKDIPKSSANNESH